MHRSWNPRGFAQQLVQLLEERWPDTGKAFWASQCGVSPAFMTGIFKMLRDEADDAWQRHQQPQKDTIALIVRKLALSDAEYNRLLLLAGHLPFPEAYLQGSLALQKLALLMADTTIHDATRASLEADLNALAEGWQAYEQARIALYRRQWDAVIVQAHASMQRTVQQMRQLPAYLLDIEAIARLHRNEIDEAEQVLQHSIITAVTDKQFPALKASILLHWGDVQREKAQWDKAKDSYEAACILLSKGNGTDTDAKVQIRAERKLATIDLFKGDWQRAPRELERCLRHFEKLGDRYELARTHQNLGWAYDLEGNWGQSRRHRLTAFALAQEHRIKGQQDWYLMMMSGVHLSSDYRQRHELDEAELTIRQALGLAKQLGEQRYEWLACLELAQIYHLKWRQALHAGQTQQSSHYLTDAGKYATEVCQPSVERSRYHQALALTVRGRLLLEQSARQPVIPSAFVQAIFAPAERTGATDEQDRLHEARALLEEAQKIFSQLQCAYHEAWVHALLCELHLEEAERGTIKDAGDRIDARRREVERLHMQFGYPQHMAQAFMVGAVQAVRQQQITVAVTLCADAWYYASLYNPYALAGLEAKFYQAVQRMADHRTLPREATTYLGEALGDFPSESAAFAGCFCLKVADALQHHAGLSRSTATHKRHSMAYVVEKVIQRAADVVRRDVYLRFTTMIDPEALLAKETRH